MLPGNYLAITLPKSNLHTYINQLLS